MPDNAPNRGDDDDAVSSDDGYSEEEDLLIIGLAVKTLESQGNKKRLHFPTVFDRREIVNPGGSAAAEEFGQKLLTGHERRFVEELRVTKVQFYQLADWISVNTSMKGSSRQSLHLKLMIFLYVIGQGCTQRAAAHHFGVSQSSVSRIMATGLEAFADIHRTFVVQPEPTEVCHEPITKPKCQYFFGCIGAVDGTHIAAWVPEEGQRKWYNRKSLITQNVLCAVRLDGTFSDPEVLRDEIAIDQWEEHLAYIEEMRQYNNAILQRKHEKHLGDEEWKAARHFRLER
ncbi:hypothetical protein CEK26_011980 [Fusarium fujikuroi]|nr:hypothetical protein CEK27_004417 [Fusarium fujikuroi]QGI68026.1 hypothetical protein CEK27_011997 [Fusarium fujikuroi]QGI98911.1 hypothetical protein CEK26_011980 [Fusarium fujikuroi]